MGVPAEAACRAGGDAVAVGGRGVILSALEVVLVAAALAVACRASAAHGDAVDDLAALRAGFRWGGGRARRLGGPLDSLAVCHPAAAWGTPGRRALYRGPGQFDTAVSAGRGADGASQMGALAAAGRAVAPGASAGRSLRRERGVALGASRRRAFECLAEGGGVTAGRCGEPAPARLPAVVGRRAEVVAQVGGLEVVGLGEADDEELDSFAIQRPDLAREAGDGGIRLHVGSHRAVRLRGLGEAARRRGRAERPPGRTW